MDINIVKDILKKDYDCQLVNIFKYENHEFCKAIQNLEIGICYRYFSINDKVEEVLDELLLSYFRENYEIHTNINY